MKKFKLNDYVAFNLTNRSGLGYICHLPNDIYYRVMVITCASIDYEAIKVGTTFPFKEDELRLANDNERNFISKLMVFT